MIARNSFFVAVTVIASLALADETLEVRVLRPDSAAAEIAPAQNFTGTVRLQSRFQRDAPSRLAGALVSFERGARTNWHTHPQGQTLVVTEGIGFVQHWQGERQLIKEGDIVWIPPKVKHWHGATDIDAMSHVAMLELLNGQSVEWMEKVTDEQYLGK